jgi:hypothetical protein
VRWNGRGGRGVGLTGQGIVTSYTTSFDGTENPLSESGAWTKTATAWQAIETASGRAYASAYTESYDDAYSLLSGFPADVQAEATIYKNGTFAYECELLFRMAQTTTTVRGYECLFNVDGNKQVVRWNGAQGNFTSLSGTAHNSMPALVTGDKVRARIVGSTIDTYYIPISTGIAVPLATYIDTTYTDGQPGIAFYVHSPVTKADCGFSDYTVNAV